MKILQILPELNFGGVERGCLDLVRALVQRKHQAIVISNGGRLVKELESLGGRHIRLSVHRKSLFTILTNIPKLTRILEQEKVDIVHARSRIPALIAFLACRRSATPFITTCHGYYSQNFFSRVMGWGKRVIVNSAVVKKHMLEDFAVPAERIRLIVRGVDLEKFKFFERPKLQQNSPVQFTVGVIGRLTPIKGHKYFLQALARAVRSLPGLRAVIVGDVSPGKEKYKEELLMLSRRLGLDRYVEFLGWQKNIPQILSGLDALVLPTVTQEAFGRVLIEAGACGVPLIATKVGGITEIVEHGVNGFLVEPRDSLNLASSMIRLATDRQLSQRLIQAARKKVELHFSLERMAERVIKVYEEVQTSLKILVIKLSALGDVLLSIPSLRALREHFPQAHISVLLADAYAPALENCPYIDQVLEIPLENKGPRRIWQFSFLLRRPNFDLVVDLQNSRASHLLAYLSGCSRRYGYRNRKYSFLLNRKVKEDNLALSPIRHQARTLKMLGVNLQNEELELWPGKNDQTWAATFLKRNRKIQTAPLVGINLGASVNWASKRWGVKNWAAVLEKMHQCGIEVLFTGKDSDQQLLQNLKQCRELPFIDAVNQTSLMQLACLIKHCSVYLSCDSAPLHIAYAMNTPVVTLFGPTDPQRHTINGPRQIVLKGDVSCSPCYKRTCRKKEHACMEAITPEQVFAAVQKLLSAVNCKM